MSENTIEVDNICMNFGPIQAVQNVSFQIGAGEIVGLLGPNGAGKTTTMRILTTYLNPTAGQVNIFGQNIQNKPIQTRKKIGYLPETAPLYTDMEVFSYLKFVGKARGLSGSKLYNQIENVKESCQIKPVMRQPIFELSKGYRQRVGLAQALIHDPDILILDEPTSGLDPLQILGIRQLIKDLSQSKTILFSTHILQEVSAVSSRALIIYNGQLIADGSLTDLQEKAHQQKKINIQVQASKKEIEESLMNAQLFKDSTIQETDSGWIELSIETGETKELWKELDQLIKAKNWPLRKFSEHQPTLEDTFIALIQASENEPSE